MEYTGKRIVILGAGIMQAPALRIAKEMGLYTVACDGNPEAPCRTLAARFENIDLKDIEGLLRLARGLKDERGGLAGVMTAGTDFSSSAAYVAEKLALPGISYETALDASDKERMRRRFAAAGVPSPLFTILRDAPSLSFQLEFAYPVVVKPVDNMGGRGCRRADGAAELKRAVEEALPFSKSGRVIVEKYMEGPEYSVDALVYRGEITICGLAERHIRYPPYFIEMGHTMSARLPPREERALLDVFRAGVRALGIDNGAAKGDMKLTADGPAVGEIAARLSGGYMSGWTYPYASGTEATRGAILIALGLPPEGLAPVKNWTSAERAFISIPGAVRAVHGAARARALRGVKDLFLRIKPGEKACFPENNVAKCGNVISAAPGRAMAIESAETAARSILIELEPDNPATKAFLAMPLDTQFPPSAFGADAAALDALELIPQDKPLSEAEAAIVPFPFSRSLSLRDYAGRSVEESIAIVRKLSGLELPEKPDGGFGRQFWRALLRGGYQGALYHVMEVMGIEPMS